MVKQKYSNGYWIGMASHVRPSCLSLYHLYHLSSPLSSEFSLSNVANGAGWFLGLLALVYFGAMAAVTGLTIREEGFPTPLFGHAVPLVSRPSSLWLWDYHVGLFNGLRWRQIFC